MNINEMCVFRTIYSIIHIVVAGGFLVKKKSSKLKTFQFGELCMYNVKSVILCSVKLENSIHLQFN